MFIDGASGDMIHRNVGFVPAEKIILNAKMAIKKNDKSEEYAKKYEAGERDFDLVMNYVKALNTAEHNSLKISNEYLRTNPDLSPEQKARFLFEADKTVDKSIEYEMVDLLEEAQDKMKSFFPKQEKVFKITSEMCYYEGMAELDKYAEKTEQYYKKIIKNDSEQLDRLSAKLAKKYKSNAEILDLAEKLSERAVKIDKTIPHLSNLASILFQNNKREKAFEVVDEAIEIAREAGEPVRNLEGMKRYFNSK